MSCILLLKYCSQDVVVMSCGHVGRCANVNQNVINYSFCLLTDLSCIGNSDSLSITADAPNKLLCELLFEKLKQIHDKELQLTSDDCMWFLQLLRAREHDGATYSLPIPLCQLYHPGRKTEGWYCLYLVKFEILTEVLVKIQVLWILTPCQPVNSYCCFGVHNTFCTSRPRRVRSQTVWPCKWIH